MTNYERIKASSIAYSEQATALILNLKENFDIDAFEQFVKTRFIVGGGHILEFLQEQNRMSIPQETPLDQPTQ